MREFYASDVQNRLIASVHPEKLGPFPHKKVLSGVSPIGHSAQSDLVVIALPRPRIEGREEHFAADAVRQFDLGLNPVKVTKRFRLKKLDLLDVFERQPRI